MFSRIPLLVLLLAFPAGPLAAQRLELLAGGGVSFTGADFADVGGHGLVGAALASGGPIGGRVDALYSSTGRGNFFALNLDATAHVVADPEAAIRPYALAGGSLLVDSDNAFAGINAGVGVRIRAGRRLGLFVEGRYFHVFGAASTADDLILASAGVAVRM